MPGEVYLVGAGPGDKKLITLKGLEKLKRADVILYDRLINDELLEWTGPEAELIYVGKKPGAHSHTQQQINQMMIDNARTGNLVVRLKGGDPLIFGRGGEEALALSRNGIDYEIVPGITSAIGASAYTGIPLTHRKVSSSVVFLTGHQVDEIKWSDLKAVDTVVIFMGVGNLSEIVSRLIEAGYAADTPVAMVRWATTEKQQDLTATLDTIVSKAEGNITPPALIIIGETVRFAGEMNWFTNNPLFGRKVLITRPKSKAGDFRDALIETGAQVISIPATKLRETPENLRTVFSRIDDYDWLVFTSTKAVRIFMDELCKCRKDARALASLKIAAVGNKTAQVCRQHWLQVDLIPAQFTGEGLLQEFAKRDIKGADILLPRADRGRSELPRGLRQAGARVEDLSVYRVLKVNQQELHNQITQEQLDLVVFTSPLAVESVCESLHGEHREILKGTVLGCIGPVTGSRLKEYGLEAAVMPDEYNLENLFEEIVAYFGGTE